MTMKKVVILALALVTQVLAKPERLYYHRDVGIPLAESIYQAEQEIESEEGIGGDNLDTRIVGGTHTSPEECRYLGGLIITLVGGNTTVCGSTLLSTTRLVTAAHCWYDGEDQGQRLVVVLGSTKLFSGGLRKRSRDVTMHEDYNSDNLDNDIAMIRIESVDYSDDIRNAILPKGDMLNDKFVGTWAKACGFGRTSSKKSGAITRQQSRKQVRLEVLRNRECRRYHGSWVRPTTLCTSALNEQKNVGTCNGDSGGPLVDNKNGKSYLIGITSYGLPHCGKYPAAFTRVTSYTAWIKDKMEE